MYVVFAVSAALILVWAVFVFNRLVRWRNLVGEAWSGVDVQLKRRYDLIPALLEAVREYTAHERELFADVARLRVRAIDAAPPEQSAAENALSGGLRSLFAVAERYPEIKASKNYLDLQENLAEVEDQIQLARRRHDRGAAGGLRRRRIFRDRARNGARHPGGGTVRCLQCQGCASGG